jgi:hyaluronoglucosaminidase
VLGNDESAYVQPLLDAFWKSYEHGKAAELDRAADKLRKAFATMRTAPSRVPDELGDEVGPWLTQLSRLGAAGERSVDMLLAQRRGDGAAAWKAQLDVRRLRAESAKSKVTVGKGVLDDFTDKALRLSDDWSGAERHGGDRRRGPRPDVTGSPQATQHHPLSAAADGDPSTFYRASSTPATGTFAPERPPVLVPPSAAAQEHDDQKHGSQKHDGRTPDKRSAQTLTVRLPKPRPLRAVTVLTGPHSGTRGTVEAHVPGKGWQRLGGLSQSGWTQLTAGRHGGAEADALRIVWSEKTKPPVVHEITPWYADKPAASLSLPRTTVDAAIGGGITRATARLTGNRPADVRGTVTAKAPKGITVRAPKHTTVRQGSTVDVPLRITVDSSVRTGSYRVPVFFGGDDKERATLTVRAFPRTSGPDLARHARVTSSGDETDDFPAAAVADGKRSTRWSSPAEDGQWVQLKLADRARLGKVVLRWQDAHPSRYRIQVSSDGKRWRTAATVRDGNGGKESVRMDSPRDTRYVRVVGDKRATRYGISLWSVELYGVDTSGQAKHARRDGDRDRERDGDRDRPASNPSGE